MGNPPPPSKYLIKGLTQFHRTKLIYRFCPPLNASRANPGNWTNIGSIYCKNCKNVGPIRTYTELLYFSILAWSQKSWDERMVSCDSVSCYGLERPIEIPPYTIIYVIVSLCDAPLCSGYFLISLFTHSSVRRFHFYFWFSHSPFIILSYCSHIKYRTHVHRLTFSMFVSNTVPNKV